MVNVSIARRYARALLEVAQAQADAVAGQLDALAQATSASAELQDLLTNPAYSKEQRLKVVGAIAAAVQASSPALLNLVKLLNDRNRLAHLGDIARIYRELVDARMGRVRGVVTSAVPLSATQLKALEAALEKSTQRAVQLEAKVDPKVLGGVAAQVGSVVFDGTLKSQLENIKRELAQ